MASPKENSFREHQIEYIRRTYGVPVKIGAPVAYTAAGDGRRTGKIKGIDGHYILIAFDDGQADQRRFHPTWNLEYL